MTARMEDSVSEDRRLTGTSQCNTVGISVFYVAKSHIKSRLWKKYAVLGNFVLPFGIEGDYKGLFNSS